MEGMSWNRVSVTMGKSDIRELRFHLSVCEDTWRLSRIWTGQPRCLRPPGDTAPGIHTFLKWCCSSPWLLVDAKVPGGSFLLYVFEGKAPMHRGLRWRFPKQRLSESRRRAFIRRPLLVAQRWAVSNTRRGAGCSCAFWVLIAESPC